VCFASQSEPIIIGRSEELGLRDEWLAVKQVGEHIFPDGFSFSIN